MKLISDNKVIDPVEDDFYTMENVIEKTWSVMWTLTDEVPSNCERFVRHNGLEISKEIIEVRFVSKLREGNLQYLNTVLKRKSKCFMLFICCKFDTISYTNHTVTVKDSLRIVSYFGLE